MSILFKARGAPSVGLLFIRLSLGSYILILGLVHANNVQAYISNIKGLGLFGDNLAFIIGFVLPFLMILLGGLYILGFFTIPTSFGLMIISLIKILLRGIILPDGAPFNKEIIFFFCFITTLFAGAGVISFDVFLVKKKKKVKEEPKPPESVPAPAVVVEPPKEPSAPQGT
ncbi:MAG: hypothetical protein ABSF32_04940 [Ignavibacteria bacterium]|jgi:uncharacterized membrane protein YphA (DoxX/SURF4 family)